MESVRSKSPGDANAITSIEYSEVEGPDLGGGVYETEWHLRVDFTRSVAELRQHSPLYDGNPDPIGFFRAQLDAGDTAALMEQAKGIRLGELPSPSGGGPGVALLRLKIERPRGSEEASFPSRDMGALALLDPLLERLGQLVGKVVKHPLQAVRLELSGRPGPDRRFHFSLRNIGTKPLTIVDPRVSSAEPGTGVRVAPIPPERPGYTAPPLRWEFVPVAVAKNVTEKPITLAPGAALEFETAPWSHKPGEQYVVQAMLATYTGPPAVQGMPVIKGRLFSANVEFGP